MKKLPILIVVFIMALFNKAIASHIVGGEITYKHLGSYNYEVKLYLFVDCLNGQAGAISDDATARIGVFDGATGALISSLSREINRTGPTRVQKLNYKCVRNTPNQCVDMYVYTYNINLPQRTGGYFLSFQRCCRNQIISNIFDPGFTGANYWTKIPQVTGGAGFNSSPVFKELPPNYLCTNAWLNFDHSATDPDGDSLVYEFFTPYVAADRNDPRPTFNNYDRPPFDTLLWIGSYNYSYPLDGSPALKIDRETGRLTGIPTREGQFVIGIKVKEYRKGVLIGETKRDYQFYVYRCIVDVVSAFYAPTYQCGYTVTFNNQSQGGTRFHWDFGVKGISDDTSNQINPSYTFPAAGVYQIKLYAYRANCVDSNSSTITIYEPKKPFIGNDTLFCGKFSYSLSAKETAYSYQWSTGQTTRSITVSYAGIYWVDKIDRKCRWRDSITISNDLSRVKISGDTTICSEKPFTVVLDAGAGYVKYTWNTGASTRTYPATNTGVFWVETVNKNGCITRDSAIIDQFPELKLNLTDTLICPGTAAMRDAENPGSTYSWSDGQTSQQAVFRQPGTYGVLVRKGKCSNFASFKLSMYPPELDLGPDTAFCGQVFKILKPLGNRLFPRYSWNEAVSTPTYLAQLPGWYFLEVSTGNGCVEKDSIRLFLNPLPIVTLPPDTTVCASTVLELDPGIYVSYLWNNGSRERKQLTYVNGLYSVAVTDANGCKNAASTTVTKNPFKWPSEMFVPNAFTPNGDGLNDVFPAHKFQSDGGFYQFKVFDRWGEKLWETENPAENWDGTVKGRIVPEGVYVYLVNWIGCDNQRRNASGNISVMR